MEENKVNKMVCPKCKSQNIDNVDGTYRCLDCGCEWRLSDAEQPKTQSLAIRNSTMEFLIFQAEGKEQGVEVFYKDENLWATQKAMSILFDVGIPDISKHLKNIFDTGELKKDTTVSKMEIVVKRGFRGEVPEQIDFYSLDAYLSSDERPLLDNAGSVSHEEAVLHAETEFEKYRIIQDRLFESDFDKYLGELPFIEDPKD